MDYKITDLMDGLSDLAPDITPQKGISFRRIQKLTVQKIAGSRVQRPVRFLSRAVLIAAVLLCLSVTVLAAVTIHRAPQPLSPEETTIGFDNDLYIGSLSNNWDAGDWTFTLQAESAGATGMTLLCTPWGQGQTGSLTTDDTFWLEVWNGTGYEECPALLAAVPTQTLSLKPNTAAAWQITWEADYGQLAPGNYRLGKTFRYRSPSGQEQTALCYAKFRVFEEENGALYNQYQAALKALRDQNSWHLTWQVFPESPTGYTSYILEIWKHGDDYAQLLRYLDGGGNSLRQSGALLHDGAGYRMALSQSGESPYTEDANLQAQDFTLWYTFLSLSHGHITEMCQNGSTITLTEDSQETVLTLEDGKITTIYQYDLSAGNRILTSVLTVHDTADAEIIRHITDQTALIP